MARTYQFTVGSAEAGLRLDHYLTRHLPTELSRAVIQRGIRQGTVTVGGRPGKASHRLRGNDVIAAHFEHLPSRSGDTPLTPQEIPLDIAYEDAHLLVVNKPPGLVTHPAPGHWDGTLVNALVWHFEQGNGLREEQPPRAGIVHRLDKETSGLLLVAKTAVVHTALSRQLKARTIRRRYLALVEGHPPLNIGTINVPVGRHPTHRKVMSVRHLGGRSAVTHYRVVKRFATEALCSTLLEVALDTGRTHQIRVHMAHLGHPVVGDATYGRYPASHWQALGVTRQLLHAFRLSFLHPVLRKELSVSAPIPEDMMRWLDAEAVARLEHLADKPVKTGGTHP